MHHLAFSGPHDRGRTFVDIWRVREGRIVEHWDVIQTIPEKLANSNGMGCGRGVDFASARRLDNTLANPTCGKSDLRANRTASVAVVEGYLRQLRAGDVRRAVEQWFAPTFRQHNPLIADGLDASIEYLRRQFGSGPEAAPRTGPIRTIAEGDFVLQHRLTYYPANKLSSANVDIFRVSEGRIIEHWDLRQPVPEHASNANGMW